MTSGPTTSPLRLTEALATPAPHRTTHHDARASKEETYLPRRRPCPTKEDT